MAKVDCAKPKLSKKWLLVDLLLRYLRVDAISGTRIRRIDHLEKIGSDYGGWIVPTQLIRSDSICYCAGVGQDITFDMGLIARFGCHVNAFDPTPKAVQFVKDNAGGESRFHFSEIGLWDRDEILRFYEPRNPLHVSHSALNLQKTEKYFEARCKRLSDLMKEKGHEKVDLLKLDIEGAEYRVVESIVKDGLDIGVICVEYDEAYNPLDKDFPKRIRNSISRLVKYGYRVVAVELKCNYTLVKKSLLAA